MIAKRIAVTVSVLLITCATLVASNERQAPPQSNAAQPASGERLNRIRADLFSATPHLTDDVVALKGVLAQDPKSAEAHVLLGIAYRGLGTQEMLAEAIAELRQAIDLDPALMPARFYLAHLYLDLGRLLEARHYLGLALLDLGRTADATTELEQVVGANAGRPEAFLALGTVYTQSGRFDDAIKVLSEGTKLDPARADLHIQLSRAYRSKGLLDRAEAELARAQPKPDAASAITCLFAPLFLSAQTRSSKPDTRPLFVDVTATSGITFVHKSGASPDKFMVETFGSGLAWIDYDNDGFPDLYFVNGAPGVRTSCFTTTATAHSQTSRRRLVSRVVRTSGAPARGFSTTIATAVSSCMSSTISTIVLTRILTAA